MRRPASVFAIAVFLVSMVVLPGMPASSVQAAAPTRPRQVVQLEISPAKLRTMDEMLADQATHVLPRAPAGSRAIPFTPGMDPAAYAAAKEAAAAAPRLPGPSVPAAPGAAPAAPATLVLNCDGEDETVAGGVFPPHADGAFGYSPTAGTLEFVQTTNVHLTVWDAVHAAFVGCSTARLFDIDFFAFFGYFDTLIFNARVVHDDTYGRWVVTAEGDIDPFSYTGAQYQFIAVSVSDDARGPYFIYQFDTTQLTCAGICHWDFPQLGMDDQAIILTANNHVIYPFGFSYINGSRWVFINKQHLYYGLGLTSCSFTDSYPSWAPPKVLDLSPLTWMAEANPYSSDFLVIAWVSNSGSICPRVSPDIFLFVPSSYSPPRSALQPGTTQKLDTLDARFQNRSTQVGNVLWQVHTIADSGGFPTIALRRIDTVRLAVQTALFHASATSDDFNPSVAANLSNTVAVSWSSTDTPAGLNAQVRVGRCAGAMGVCSPGSGTLVFQSTVPLVGNPSGTLPGVQGWGNYSSTVIDGSGGFFGGVNEEINNPDDAAGHTWGTRFYVAAQ